MPFSTECGISVCRTHLRLCPDGFYYHVQEGHTMKKIIATTNAPAAIGDVVLQNVCGTGVDVVASKNVARIS